MPTFVYMTRCDGCGHCVDICPSDIMHIDPIYRRAYNIEPNMCWECYSCVKAYPRTSIPKLADVPAPSKEARDGQLLYNEPKWIRMDEGGLRTLKDAGLKLKKGVYY